MGEPHAVPPGGKRQLWTANQVAAYLQASRAWVYREANAGHLPCVRFLGLLRFEPEVIERLKDASRTH